MNREISIPAGDGTAALIQIKQGWLKVAQEVLLVVLEGREDFSSGVKAFAETEMFATVEEPSNISPNIMLTLKSIFENNFHVECQLSLSQQGPGLKGSWAAIVIQHGGKTANIWFSNALPYAGVAEASTGDANWNTSSRIQEPKKTVPQQNWRDWDREHQFSREDVHQQQQDWRKKPYPSRREYTTASVSDPLSQLPARFRSENNQSKRVPTPYERPRMQAPARLMTKNVGPPAGSKHPSNRYFFDEQE